MLMLGRELPSVPKVDNFAAVEMLASKRHQNPRQVKYKSIDSLTKGWAPTITVSRVYSHFPMLHIFIAEGVYQFCKRTHFEFQWCVPILKYCLISVPRVFSNTANLCTFSSEGVFQYCDPSVLSDASRCNCSKGPCKCNHRYQ